MHLQHIKLNAAVDAMAQQPDGTWTLTTSAALSGSGTPQIHTFDFLVVATGLYSGRECNMPSIPGSFDGDVMHKGSHIVTGPIYAPSGVYNKNLLL